VASAFATFGTPCTIYFAGYRLWDRFRDAPWQQIARVGLVPVVMGLVIASGTVMARAADSSWQAVAITIAAAAITLATRLSPMWMLLVGGALGGLGLLYACRDRDRRSQSSLSVTILKYAPRSIAS
jgi:chromate transporter